MTNQRIFSETYCLVSPSGVAFRRGVSSQILRISLVWILLPGFAAVAQHTPSATPAATSDAQSVPKNEFDAVKELARMTKRYGLGDEQKKKIQPILADQQAQVHQLGEDESLSNAEWAAAVQEVHRQTVLKIKPLMTDSQLSKYTKDEAKRAKHSLSDPGDDGFDGPPGGPPPGGPPGGPGGFGPPGE